MLILLYHGNANQQASVTGTTTSSGTVHVAPANPVTYPQQRRQISRLHKIGDHREGAAVHAQHSTGNRPTFQMGMYASVTGTTHLTGGTPAPEIDVRTFRRRRDENDLLLLVGV